jgi:hypothetical protein
MLSFLTRVEPHGADAADYQRLHDVFAAWEQDGPKACYRGRSQASSLCGIHDPVG